MNRVLRWLVPLVAIGVLGLLGFGLTTSPRKLLPSALIDRAAPDFELGTLFEPADSIALRDLRGRVVVLNYWASWCFPCIQEHPYLELLSQSYDTADVRLLGMLYQDTPENGRAFIRQYGGGWPTLVDPGSETAIPYGVYGPPETFVVSPEGIVVHKLLGPLTSTTYPVVKSKIDSLLAARDATGEMLETGIQR